MNLLKTRLALGGQKGITALIVLIVLAVVIGIIAITYGYFILTGKTAPSQDFSAQKVTLTKEDPLQSKVGTPECPELDYTGCDTSGNFMTWEDDGERNP